MITGGTYNSHGTGVKGAKIGRGQASGKTVPLAKANKGDYGSATKRGGMPGAKVNRGC